MKAYIENLCIEVTRKCNMRCEHCLRGNAQNVDIDMRHIDAILSHCEGINSITFTGGEPTLNLTAIEYTINEIVRREIPLGSFYVVTNGKVFRNRLVDILDKAYEYCYEKEICGLAVSNDEFHRKYQNEKFNHILSRYRYRDDYYDFEREYFRINDKRWNFLRGGLLDEGRAKNLPTYYERRENKVSEYVEDNVHLLRENYIGGTLYLNALGELVNGCDWSYASQKQRKIATIHEWDNFISKLPKIE